MLIVISQDRDLLCAALTCLSTKDLPSVIVAQNVGVALSLMEVNDVEAVVVHEPSPANPITRVVGRRFPQIACIPISSPLDFDDIGPQLVRGGHDSAGDAVVAHGVEDLLGLLAMTRRSADIAVTAGRNYGVLAIADGQIIDARVGDDHGRESALRILSWHAARLCARGHDPVQAEAPMHLPILAALAEAARRQDELQRLGCRADIDAALRPLQTLQLAGVLLADTDNGTPDVERAAQRQCDPRRLWHAAEVSSIDSSGVALWDTDGNVVALPVGRGRALAVACTPGQAPGEQRRVVVAAARELSRIVTEICAGGHDAAAAGALQWG